MRQRGDDAEAHLLLGLVLHARDDLAGARESFQRALAHDPANAEAVSLEAAGRPGGRALTSAERDDVAAFLREGMTDLYRLPERPEVVPSGLMVPLDGYRIPR